mgnify:CR=1 FL=1
MNTTLQVRISKQRKEGARKILEKVGLDLSSGINLFLEHVIVNKGVPFAPSTHKWTDLRHWKLYEKEIAWAKKHGKRYSSVDEVMKALDVD